MKAYIMERGKPRLMTSPHCWICKGDKPDGVEEEIAHLEAHGAWEEHLAAGGEDTSLAWVRIWQTAVNEASWMVLQGSRNRQRAGGAKGAAKSAATRRAKSNDKDLELARKVGGLKRREGLSRNAIAKRLGASPKRVSRILRRKGT